MWGLTGWCCVSSGGGGPALLLFVEFMCKISYIIQGVFSHNVHNGASNDWNGLLLL